MIRLLDGSRTYLHAVIDNFSRRILAWKVSASFLPNVTAELLQRAASNLADVGPTVLVDGGVEYFNHAVDELVDSGLLKRLLARAEITFSYSLTESWWRVLKHPWLYLNTLDTVTAVENLIAFYVNEHNRRLPHSAARRRMKCTLEREAIFQNNSRPPGKLLASLGWRPTARLAVRRANRCRSSPPNPARKTLAKITNLTA